MYTHKLAAQTHSMITAIISVAHSQTHIQTHWLQPHVPMALIKGRNVIDRGEREKERGGSITVVCGTE